MKNENQSRWIIETFEINSLRELEESESKALMERNFPIIYYILLLSIVYIFYLNRKNRYLRCL